MFDRYKLVQWFWFLIKSKNSPFGKMNSKKSSVVKRLDIWWWMFMWKPQQSFRLSINCIPFYNACIGAWHTFKIIKKVRSLTTCKLGVYQVTDICSPNFNLLITLRCIAGQTIMSFNEHNLNTPYRIYLLIS